MYMVLSVVYDLVEKSKGITKNTALHQCFLFYDFSTSHTSQTENPLSNLR